MEGARVGGIYRPVASEDKDELFLRISTKRQTFVHFCQTFSVLLYPTALGQIKRLIVLN